MRWALKQRMKYIEDVLGEKGCINRRDLISKFGISVPQASNDIRAFVEANPGRIHYDVKKKTYVSTTTNRNERKTRDTAEAAKSLVYADDEWLQTVARRDPDMIRDVAAALLYERDRP